MFLCNVKTMDTNLNETVACFEDKCNASLFTVKTYADISTTFVMETDEQIKTYQRIQGEEHTKEVKELKVA